MGTQSANDVEHLKIQADGFRAEAMRFANAYAAKHAEDPAHYPLEISRPEAFELLLLYQDELPQLLAEPIRHALVHLGDDFPLLNMVRGLK